MANGRIVETIERADLDGAMDRLHEYLGV
jgi:hypothetical protein